LPGVAEGQQLDTKGNLLLNLGMHVTDRGGLPTARFMCWAIPF
jgi:hypothetical protein